MTSARIFKFRGNPRPAVRHGISATVIVLPVIRIERYDDEPSPKRRRRGDRAAPPRGAA